MTTPNVFGTHEEKTLAQLADVATRAERVALMADGHLGYLMPIGGVAAYDNQVSVVGVSPWTSSGLVSRSSEPPQAASRSVRRSVSARSGRRRIARDITDRRGRATSGGATPRR